MDYWQNVLEVMGRKSLDAAGLEWDEVDEETRRGMLGDMEEILVTHRDQFRQIAVACFQQIEHPDRAEHDARVSEILAPILSTHWAFQPRREEIDRIMLA